MAKVGYSYTLGKSNISSKGAFAGVGRISNISFTDFGYMAGSWYVYRNRGNVGAHESQKTGN